MLRIKQIAANTHGLYAIFSDGSLRLRYDNAWRLIELPEPDRKQSATPRSQGKRQITEEDGPSERHFEYGKKNGINVGAEWGKFFNYCRAHDKRYADYEAAFRNWLANSRAMSGGNHAVR